MDPALDTRAESQSTSRSTESYPCYALKIHGTRELTTKQALESRGYKTLLPTYPAYRKYTDRLKKVEAPLIPGYVFCRFDLDRRLPILTTPGVQHLVGFGSKPEPISESEVLSLETVAASSAVTQPYPYVRAGQKIKIELGPLAGAEGIVLKSTGSDILVISIDLLQRSVAVEIPSASVRPVSPEVC